MEAISADGSAVPPGFVLLKGETGEWWTVPGVGWYVGLFCIYTILIFS